LAPALLISIARPEEIEPALAGGAQILDVKDPTRGSLGEARAHVVRAASRSRSRGRVPVSAALGDRLAPPAEFSRTISTAFQLAGSGAEILKIGLAGVEARTAVAGLIRLREALAGAENGLARDVRVVAVAFVGPRTGEDGEALEGRAPPGVHPDELPDIAAIAGVAGAMLDTLRKGRSILELLGQVRLRAWVQAVRDRGLLCGIAGSLALEDVPRAAALGVDVVGLRSAVCTGGRQGTVLHERVARARALLDAPAVGDPPSELTRTFAAAAPWS
jgi:uncharacterized protein (UPF0264 family)